MKKTALIMIAGALAVSGMAPAFAKTAPKPEPVKAEDVAKDTKKYCVMTESTGTRIAKKVCMTRAEWLNEGFDPLNPDK